MYTISFSRKVKYIERANSQRSLSSYLTSEDYDSEDGDESHESELFVGKDQKETASISACDRLTALNNT